LRPLIGCLASGHATALRRGHVVLEGEPDRYVGAIVRYCDCVGVDQVPRNADSGAGAAGYYSSRCRFVLHPTVARRRCWLGACKLSRSALALGALRGSSVLSQRGGACVPCDRAGNCRVSWP
jgi:hypothetical protein